jgi:tetratricopeptide (TPR) repeat protein
MYEAFASPRIQAITAGMTGGYSQEDPFDAKYNLRSAEAEYNRVLKIAPGLVEARVRRGRVRSLRGNQKDAVADLRAAVVAARDPFVKYHALLFLGGAYEALGDLEQARDAYQRAAALYGLAQSPHLALSRLAIRRGDMPAAQREVQQVLRLAPTLPTRGDPWWLYYAGSGLHVTEMFTELRAAIAAARGPS